MAVVTREGRAYAVAARGGLKFIFVSIVDVHWLVFFVIRFIRGL